VGGEQPLTEDVDVAEVLRYFGPQRGHLRSICHVELHDGDLPALLYASGLVRGARSLCDLHQLVGSAREEDQVRAPLDDDKDICVKLIAP
jgi:hypothetical protein